MPSWSKTPGDETECSAAQGAEMGVGIQERTETLRGDDHGRDRLFAGRKVRREKLACGGVCDLCELAVECALEEKVLAEHLRDRKNDLQVRDIG